MSASLLTWVLLNLFVVGMLALDLGVFHRKEKEVKFREAILWSLVWIVLALIFNLGIYFWKGQKLALEFLTGYLIEKSLSVDNIFVFLLIFTYLKVPSEYQHKVLFWGILGALVMRALFIATGIALIQKFHWVIYVFGAFLVLTGIKLALEKKKDIHPERNPVLKLFRRIMPVTPEYNQSRFFVRLEGRWFATPLFVVLLVVETTDLIFAVDSIPAILAITQDPFIVYTSNVFAILGLRAMFFLLAGIMGLFRFLKIGLCIVLMFVGVKMLISDFYKIPISISLVMAVSILASSVLASVLFPPAEERAASLPGKAGGGEGRE